MSKRVPLSFAVMSPAKANKALAAEGKSALMQKIRELTNDGEKLAATLMRIATSADKDSDALKAIELLLNHGFGKPVETSVTMDATPKSGGLNSLTAEQLTALASAPPRAEEEEGVIVADESNT